MLFNSVNVSLRRLVIGGAIVFLQCAQSAFAQLSSEEMDGIWEGPVSIVDVAPDTAPDGIRVGDSTRLRMEIFPDRVRVSAGPNSSELQMIHIGRLDSSAIILGVMRSDDQTETWVLTASLEDPRTMLVALSRGVKAIQKSEGAEVFTVGALGKLQQVDDD
jgi:hypothetical protein